MKTLFLFSRIVAIGLLIFVLCSCGGSDRKAGSETNVNDTMIIVGLDTALVKLEPLKDEALEMGDTEELFGEIIELKGEQIVVDSLYFEPIEINMVIKDSLMLMKTFQKMSYNSDDIFMLFSLPDFRVIKTFGRVGNGPDEFIYPNLCRNTDPDILATILEPTKGTMYDVLPNGTLKRSNTNLPRSSGWGDGREAALKTDSLLYYAADTPTGRSIFTIDESDSIREIQNLDLDPKRKSWMYYIGNFAVNTEQTRMVYAYKYFRIIKFFDMEHHTVRTLNFEGRKFDERTMHLRDGLDHNVSHYCSISADKYIYLMYSGRIPVEVAKDNRNKENYYMLIEKYDWNGKPMAKYKLDQWGHFTVDEKNNMIYLVSTNHDDPFFRYQL